MRSPRSGIAGAAWMFGSMGLLLAFFSGSMVMMFVDRVLRTSGPASLSEAEISVAVLMQKVKMHEDEGDRLRADIVTYESRVAELEKHLAKSMASTEASLALATSNTDSVNCDEEAVLKLGGKKTKKQSSSSSSASSVARLLPSSSSFSGKEGGLHEEEEEEEGEQQQQQQQLAPPAAQQRGAQLFERSHDGSIVTAVLPSASASPNGQPEELNEEKRARVRSAVEAHRRTTVVDKGKREYDSMGNFVGYNDNKKVQLPRNYFIDFNETTDSYDVRPDGTYKGYGTPKRKAWLNKHTKRILHDFQWVYENNRVHQRQRFMGVRIGQDPFDALVIQEMLYDVKPDLIIETGTNSGGGALFMAVMMEAINPDCKIFTIDTVPISAWVKRFKNSATGGVTTTATKNMPMEEEEEEEGVRRRLMGNEEEEDEIDGLVDPRDNPFWQKRVTQAVGKSTDRRILRQLKHDFVAKAKKVLVVLDSDHSSGTVLSELINYAPFVSLGSYILVEDTWQRHPLFAAEKFLENYGSEFIQDRSREHLMWSQHKGGYLKRVKLPARTKAGDLDYDYKVNVEVSGGRVKTYEKVDMDAAESAPTPNYDKLKGAKK